MSERDAPDIVGGFVAAGCVAVVGYLGRIPVVHALSFGLVTSALAMRGGRLGAVLAPAERLPARTVLAHAGLALLLPVLYLAVRLGWVWSWAVLALSLSWFLFWLSGSGRGEARSRASGLDKQIIGTTLVCAGVNELTLAWLAQGVSPSSVLDLLAFAWLLALECLLIPVWWAFLSCRLYGLLAGEWRRAGPFSLLFGLFVSGAVWVINMLQLGSS